MINLKRTYSRAFSCVCLLGFLIQLEQISELYFRFQTTSKTEYRIPEVDFYQTLMYCPNVLDLLDRSRYKELGILPKPAKNMEDTYHDMSLLTVKDLMEMTPPASKAIRHCVVRQGMISAPLVMNREECEAFFEVSKTITGERVCYTFKPRVPQNYSVEGVASSLTHTGYVYRLDLHPAIGMSRYATFMATIENHNKPEDFLNSRPYAAKSYNDYTFSKSRITVNGESNDIYKLPPPYDTKCIQGHNRGTCYNKCLTKKFNAIHRVSWSGSYDEKVNLKMSTPLDYENQTLGPYINQTFEECHSRCKLKIECFMHFTRTTIQIFSYTAFSIASMLPSLPRMIVYAVPCLNLVEYIVQIGSCFGIWFGLSIISINPTKWKISQMNKSTLKPNNNRVIKLFIMLKNPSHQ